MNDVNRRVSVPDAMCMPLWDVFDEHPDFAADVECRLDEEGGPDLGPLCETHEKPQVQCCISDDS